MLSKVIKKLCLLNVLQDRSQISDIKTFDIKTYTMRIVHAEANHLKRLPSQDQDASLVLGPNDPLPSGNYYMVIKLLLISNCITVCPLTAVLLTFKF